MTDLKASMYKTAVATIACAHFKAGDVVSITYDGTRDSDGTRWFTITQSQHGPLPYPVAYPEHHLTNFVL
jgi:hypothetical protein